MPAGLDTISARWLTAVCIVALCAACDGDPTAGDPVCSGETQVILGTPVDGVLREDDHRFAGAYIDYYGLQVDSTARLTVRMASTELDPFLLLFDAHGDVIAQAFHAVGTLPGVEQAPSITRSFDPGCHLLGATSYTPNATGAYTLTVEPAGP